MTTVVYGASIAFAVKLQYGRVDGETLSVDLDNSYTDEILVFILGIVYQRSVREALSGVYPDFNIASHIT